MLTRSPTVAANRRLVEAGKERGHVVALLDPLSVPLHVASEKAGLSPFGEAQALIPRFGPELQRTGLAVVRMAEARGLRSLNGAVAFERARDKLASLQLFAAAGLPLPATVIVSDPSQARWAVAAVGGPPLVIKQAEGWRGQGIVLADTSASALSILDGLADATRPLMVQRYVAEAEQRDLRLLVIEGEVRASMVRTAAEGEFRANVSCGGRAEGVTPTEAQRALAVRATELLGLRVAGVDLLPTPSGDLLLEVNAAPGFAALEEATQEDVAGMILESAVSAVASVS